MPFHLAFCTNDENPYFNAVLEHARALLADDPDITLMEWKGFARFPLAAIPYLKPDGVLVGAATEEDVAQLPRDIQIFGFSNSLETTPFVRVVNDDIQVGRLAANALADAGYAHWMVYADNDHHHGRQRIAGMRAVAESNGIPLHRLNLTLRRSTPDETFSDVWREHEASLEASLAALKPNTAILATSEATANEVLDALREFSARAIPDELGLVVADEVHPTGRKLACVRLDAEGIVRRLLEWIRLRVHTPDAPLPDVEFLPPKGLVDGETLRPSTADLPTGG